MPKGTLSKKLIILNLLFAFLPFVILCVILVSYFSRTILKEREDSNRFVAESISGSVSEVLRGINEVSISMIVDNDIRKFLLLDVPIDHPDYLTYYSDALANVKNSIIKESTIQDIYIESLNGNLLSVGIHHYLRLTDQERDLLDRHALGTWCWNYENGQLSMCRVMRDIYNIGDPIGFQKIVIDARDFFDLFSSSIIPEDIYFSLLDGDGQALIDNVPEQLDWLVDRIQTDTLLISDNINSRASLAGDNGDFLVYPKLIMREKTYLVAFSADHTDLYTAIVVLTIGCGVLFFLMLVYLQTLLHRKLLIGPIEKLVALMENIDTNDFTSRLDVQAASEMQVLADKFNNMADRLQVLYKQVYVNELRLKESEIKNLQMEINPHFLYNTLDSICWMINTRRTNDAERMLHMMSQLFRLSLYRTPDGLIPLSHEIEHARCFMDLQLLRFGDRIHFTIDIQDGLDDVYVVKLALQPLLENAINHGISPADRRGSISLAIYEQDETLFYYVIDDGVGIDTAAIKALLKTGQTPGGAEKIALFNIDQRIRLKFGDEYGISCHSPSQGGSIFVIRQPIVRKEDPARVQIADR